MPLLLLLSVLLFSPADIDWSKAQSEAVQLLQELIRIDTTNPPGNELATARHIQRVLETDGIESYILNIAPGRANLYARIKGDGSKRPLILLSHTDVVMADTARWSIPPFSGELRDGFVYGRGAIDMKGTAAVHVTLMRLLKRHNVPLKRDVILLAVADEEAGGLGAASIIKDYPDLIRGAEFLLNEGDVAYVKNGKLQQYGVDVMEKAALWLRITASGPTGHGSIPIENSSVNLLLNALARLRAWETPISVPPAVAEGYRIRAKYQTDPVLRAAYANLEQALKKAALRKRLLTDGTLNAEVRNTFTITGLNGSEKVNVIPGSAWAQIDARLLPGETPEGLSPTSCSTRRWRGRRRVRGHRMTRTPEEAVRGLWSVLNDRDYDGIADWVTDDCIYYDVPARSGVLRAWPGRHRQAPPGRLGRAGGVREPRRPARRRR